MRAVIVLALLAGCGSEVYLTTDDDPPSVTLIRPVDLTIFDPAQPVELCALIEDNDDAEELRVTLEGNRAGPLQGGFGDCEGGNWVASVTLDAFPHVLALTAIDTRGQSTAVVVSLVPEDNAPPFCAWGVPADATEVEAGVPVTVELTVGDPDGPASDLSFALRSTIDGTLSTTTPPSDGQVRATLATLSPGVHDLSATVVDGRGLTATCGVQLKVLACVDADRDGVTTCDEDCSDADPTMLPGGTEAPDGRDNDCDGVTDNGTTLFDDDGDGYREVDGDCDDADPDRSPGAADAPYDGLDADCGGGSDDDADHDGFDAVAQGGTDCDDADALQNPGADEVWYDGEDQDCDGTSDFDADRDGYDAAAGGGPDCDDADRATSPGVAERWYDGVDSDCDGEDDFDRDHDGERSSAIGPPGGTDCDDGNPTIGTASPERWYDGVDSDCAGDDDFDRDRDGERADFTGGTDCDDALATVGRNQPEVWYDGVDGDCSGGSDFDQDGDGQTSAATNGADCDDTNPAIFLGAAEVWYDGIDQDCEAGSDYDRDADGFSAPGAPDGSADDCDDGARAIHPGALEIWYDDVDEDCDGGSDYDRDHDGYTVLSAPDGSANDCDDGRTGVHPGAAETPYDGVDADCAGDSDFDADGDGQIADVWGGADCDDADDAIFLGAREVWYDGVNTDCAAGSDYDQDNDGYTREGAPDGTADDCNDSALGYAVHPNGVEVWYDGLDEDCDGGSDYDRDGDGFESAIFVDGGPDCDDSTTDIAPGAPEARNGGDDDCDGACDEGLIRAGDLVITEVMRDSDAVDDSFGEWFELYNATGTDVVMCSGWTVYDDGADTFDVLRAVTVPAHDYVLFARSDDPARNGGMTVDYEYGAQMAISNGDDEVILAFDGLLIDRVAWVGGWPWVTGHSIELDNGSLNATTNNNQASWCSASVRYGDGDFGTPGLGNHGCP